MLEIRNKYWNWLTIAIFGHCLATCFAQGKPKLVDSAMPKYMADEALEAVEAAYTSSSEVDAALDAVAEAFANKYEGTWYCFKTHPNMIKSKIIRDTDLYALMEIASTHIILFKMEMGTTDGSSKPCKPSVKPSASEADLVRETRKVIGSKENIKIYHNSLSDDTKEEVFFLVKWSVERETDFGSIESITKDGLESKFGGFWRCFVMCREGEQTTSNGVGIINYAREKAEEMEPLIYFGVGKIKVLVYKPSVSSSQPTPKPKPCPTTKPCPSTKPCPAPKPCPTERPVVAADRSRDMINSILEARANINDVEINQTDITSTSIRSQMIAGVQQAILKHDNYDEISKECKDFMDTNYGRPYTCVVGYDGYLWTYFYYERPYFMNLKIEKVRVLFYKQLYARPIG